MSNDTPPRACLADFQLEGGTVTFMSPELLIPEEFSEKDAVPTPQSDIYAFGLVVFQVCEQDYGYLLFSCITPFRS